MSEEYNSKWLFPTGDGDRPTIEEFEKMHILRSKYQNDPALKPLEDHLYIMSGLKLTDTKLPWHEMMTEARELLNSVSRKLAE